MRKHRSSSTLILLLVLGFAVVYFLYTTRNSPSPAGTTPPQIVTVAPGDIITPGPQAGITTAPPAGVTVPPSAGLGKRTKTSGCRVQGPNPDSACTPGAAFADVTRAQICQPGYAKSVRNVPTSTKDEVYAEYGIPSHKPGEYEVDHLVSLELGGSNEIANLWPEAADPRPGFHEKDVVENYLHQQVCNGEVSLHDAQIKIATDWLSVYKQIPTENLRTLMSEAENQ